MLWANVTTYLYYLELKTLPETILRIRTKGNDLQINSSIDQFISWRTWFNNNYHQTVHRSLKNKHDSLEKICKSQVLLCLMDEWGYKINRELSSYVRNILTNNGFYPANKNYRVKMTDDSLVTIKNCEAREAREAHGSYRYDIIYKGNELKEKTMSNSFETKHYINGVDFAGMDLNQALSGIKKLEQEIDNLKEIKSESTAVKKRINELNKMLKKVVKLTDEKFG